MKPTRKIIAGAVLSIAALFANSATAATIAHWTFDSFTSGSKITSVTSNEITLSANSTTANREPTASDNVPSAHSDRSASAYITTGEYYLGSSGVVSELNFAAGQAFTIEGWFNVNDVAASYSIFSNRGTGNDGYSIVMDKGKLTFQINDTPSGMRSLSTSAATVASSAWYYFAATRKNDGIVSLSLYGTSQGIETVTNSTWIVDGAINTDSKTYIGRGGDVVSSGFKGYIGEIRISDTALTADQLLWSTAIPEPTTLALLAGMAGLICTWATRRFSKA